MRKAVKALLSDNYTIDYYQREYKWETKQIQELLEDLTGSFLEDYQVSHSPGAVKNYGRYFWGQSSSASVATKTVPLPEFHC